MESKSERLPLSPTAFQKLVRGEAVLFPHYAHLTPASDDEDDGQADD